MVFLELQVLLTFYSTSGADDKLKLNASQFTTAINPFSEGSHYVRTKMSIYREIYQFPHCVLCKIFSDIYWSFILLQVYNIY